MDFNSTIERDHQPNEGEKSARSYIISRIELLHQLEVRKKTSAPDLFGIFVFLGEQKGINIKRQKLIL